MVRRSVCLLLLLLLSGCLQTNYMLQAIYGQDDISWRARPIEDAIADPAVPDHTRQMLSLIEDVKRFGEQHALKPTDSYRQFVQLNRNAAVYVVSASHPLRFESFTWWFPIVGSVPYLGWFSVNDAKRFAEDLSEAGWDVDLRGASAYSTLGWFNDPILSTMIPSRPSAVGDLVGVTLHESVHATFYISGQTYFNESLADYVGDELAMDYLRNRLQLDRWQLLAYEQAQDRRVRRAQRFHQAYKQLETLYASKELSDQEKLDDKARITDELRREVNFWRPINNAVLAQSRQYHGAKPPFDRLLAHCAGDWRRFWLSVKRIDDESFSKPQQTAVDTVIAPLLKAPCPTS
jgi:predicted aminopeptidase